jgi:lysophospholipase L1-like esterase
MPKTVKYIGTARRWPERATTGMQSVWFPGQAEQRSDLEAAQLLATGLFFDVDATQLPESKVVAISGVVSGGGKARRVARMFYSRLGTLSNATLSTYHVAAEVQQHFDAVSLVIVNTSAVLSGYFVAKVSVSAALGDGNNSAGTWTSCTDFGGDTGLITPLAPPGTRAAYLVTKPQSISSVARSDGGTKPLVFARAYCVDANASLPCYGDGSESLTNWATRTDGRLWLARTQTGDQVTTPSGFTNTTNVSQSPIVGLVYWARGAVVGVSSFGDSTTNGQGTFKGEGWVVPALNAAATVTGIPIEYANYSYPGERGIWTVSGGGFLQRALDVLRNPYLRPDSMILQSASLNPITGLLTQAIFDEQAAAVRKVLSKCSAEQTRVLLSTTMPITTAGNAYGSSDAFRAAYNAATVANYSAGVTRVSLLDTSGLIGGVADGSGQIQIPPGYTSDGIHLNDAGNAALLSAGTSAITTGLIQGVL